MRALGRFAWALAATIGLGSAAAAQDGASASVDMERIGVEDVVQLTITLQGAATGVAEVPRLPLDNLSVAGGPSVSTQMSFVNGAMSQSKSLTYVLKPLAEGTARIGVLTLSAGGHSWSTQPLTIEVVPGKLRPDTRPRRSDPFGWDPFGDPFARRRDPGPEPKLRVAVLLDRDAVYVGEPVVATYVVDTQASVSDVQLVSAPQYPGFWAEDLETPRAGNGEAVTIEGESYRRFPILKKLLFPTRSGELTIPPASFRLGLPRRGFFDAGAASVERQTSERSVEVKPLPAAEGFSGAVGRFETRASLDRRQLGLGDAATLSVEVSGRGNLKWLDAPPAIEVPGLRVYPPEASSDLRIERGGMVGTRTWEYVVVPETTGEFTLPPVEFRFFEPEAQTLMTSVTAPLSLSVEGGTMAGSVPSVPVAGERSLALRAELETAGAGLPALGPRFVSMTAALFALVHVGLFVSGWLGESVRLRAGRSSGRSLKQALHELDRAAEDTQSKEAAAGLIERVLHDVFGPLDEHADGERERSARAVLEEVQFLRYAPQLGDYTERIHTVARKAADVVRRWG